MTDDLRAAAERLANGDLTSPLWVTELRAVGAAYLAANPADDAEPVTEEWLKSVGGVRPPQAAWLDWEFPNGRRLRWWGVAPGDSAPWVVAEPGVAIGNGDTIPPAVSPTTRGAVRQLLKALGTAPIAPSKG